MRRTVLVMIFIVILVGLTFAEEVTIKVYLVNEQGVALSSIS